MQERQGSNEWTTRQTARDREREIVFALSMFAQFSAGQILACVLSSRSSLLGFNLTPCPHRLKGKKGAGRGWKEEDKWERNSKRAVRVTDGEKQKAGKRN